MPSGGSKSQKPKPAEVASEAKKNYIPAIKNKFGQKWKSFSYLYHQPLTQLTFDDVPRQLGTPKLLSVKTAPGIMGGDPVDSAIRWSKDMGNQVAFICGANEKRPGGDWETGVVGYEGRAPVPTKQSLGDAGNPWPEFILGLELPYSSRKGGIMSEHVVVFRGPHDLYEKRPSNEWEAIPVCSVAPTRWPKLKEGGTQYSFHEEREIVKNKLRAALRICAYNQYQHVVIGDFGLGNGYRNPPQELAELWREIILWDPEIRGRIIAVAFVFEDPSQSTMQNIRDDLAKRKAAGNSKGKSKSSASHSPAGARSNSPCLTDFQIYDAVFSQEEIQRVVHQPDPRCGLGNLMA